MQKLLYRNILNMQIKQQLFCGPQSTVRVSEECPKTMYSAHKATQIIPRSPRASQVLVRATEIGLRITFHVLKAPRLSEMNLRVTHEMLGIS
jgi:hypothetical protein